MFPRITKLKKRFIKSKKGFTLVEVLASIFVLVIIFTGVLSAVAFSRQMVFTDNSKEKASDEGQLIADEMLTLVSGECVDVTDVQTQISSYYSSASKNPVDVTSTGGFHNPTSLDPATGDYIQYTVEEVGGGASTDVDVPGGISHVETVQHGFKITVRVYYSRINGNGGYNCEEIIAFSHAKIT